MYITPKSTSVSDGFHSHSLLPHDGRSLSHIELRLSSVVDNIITWGKTVSYHDTNIHLRCFLHNRFAWNLRQYYLNLTGILLRYMKSIFNCFLCAICQSFIWYYFFFLSNIYYTGTGRNLSNLFYSLKYLSPIYRKIVRIFIIYRNLLRSLYT